MEFARESDGSLATWTAAVAFPLFMCVALAVDMQSASKHRSAIEDAADSAVLAAALHGGLSAKAKRDFAERQFRDAFSGDPATLKSVRAEADGKRVTLDVRSQFPSKLSYFTQINDAEFTVARAAETTAENTICVLSLSKDAKAAIEFKGDVQFSAPSCSVHTNSANSKALETSSSWTPVAKSFCATGGTLGSFNPPGNTECSPIGDPYANLQAPAPGHCEPEIRFTDVGGVQPTGGTTLGAGGGGMTTTVATLPGAGTLDPYSVKLQGGDSTNVVVDSAVLVPGTYCGGLTIAGRDVRMLPGEYVMLDGPFVVKDGATVNASETLVSLSGVGSVLRVEDLGEIEISAPRVGPRAGLAIMLDKRNLDPKPNRISKIRDGAMKVTGTVYLPNHHLDVKGTGTNIGAQAPATSFIVDTIRFMGSGRISVSVDHLSAGIPAIQPRSDEGARLIR